MQVGLKYIFTLQQCEDNYDNLDVEEGYILEGRNGRSEKNEKMDSSIFLFLVYF